MYSPALLRVTCLTALLLPQTAWAEGELLRNGGMEGPFARGLAAGWVKNCYGDNAFAFAEETRDVHGGKSAQRVTCTKFVSGGVQFHSGDIAVEKGKFIWFHPLVNMRVVVFDQMMFWVVNSGSTTSMRATPSVRASSAT